MSTPQTMLDTASKTVQYGNGGMFISSNGAGNVVSAAVTLNAQSSILTTPSLNTAAGSSYSFTFTNSFITTSSVVIAVTNGGTTDHNNNSIVSATAGAGTSTVTAYNNSANSWNGTTSIHVIVF